LRRYSVAIARAFLRAPRLLLADEATSALDTATEVGILQSLNEVAQGRTAGPIPPFTRNTSVIHPSYTPHTLLIHPLCIPDPPPIHP
jgi:ABC-type dipeptide/oligopeptide/nickel transport system ATPase subunit